MLASEGSFWSRPAMPTFLRVQKMTRWKQLPPDFNRQLANWITWCHRNDGRPSGFRSIMSVMFQNFKSGEGDGTMPVDPIIKVADLDAQEFDALVTSLSNSTHHRYRDVFLIRHLDRYTAGERTRIVRWRDMNRKYSLLGMSRSTFERTLAGAEADIRKRGGL